MPRNPDRTREEWIKDEKRSAGGSRYVKYSTLKEVAAVLGRDEKTIKRRLQRGAMPSEDALTVHGWRLWSPATVKRLIQEENLRKKKKPKWKRGK